MGLLRCVQALLKLICELAKDAGRVDLLNRMMVSLYAVLVCEVLISTPKVSVFCFLPEFQLVVC